jgi:hypothetical protein
MTTYTVITCRRAKKQLGDAPRHYGYTLALNPPREITIEGDDVEGVGWVPFNPPKQVTVKWQGWYKYRESAQRRADELNRS